MSIKKLLMALQAVLLVLGLLLLYASGTAYWNIVSNGIPEIVDLKTLHTTKATYARVTAALDDTGVHIPRDKEDSESHFYTIELEGKRVLVNSLHEREEGRASTFFVRVHPYEGTHVEIYFAFLAAAQNVPVREVRAEYADKMLQYFDSNPKTYDVIMMLIGTIVFGSGLIWTLKAKNIKEMVRAIFTFKDDDDVDAR